MRVKQATHDYAAAAACPGSQRRAQHPRFPQAAQRPVWAMLVQIRFLLIFDCEYQ
jgi:hypothetical protein